MNLSTMMKAEAVKNGLCQQWTDEWEDNSTKEQLIKKFLRGFDFCIRTNFPSPEQMKDYFDGDMQKFGIYSNEKVVNDEVRGNIYLNGDCNAVLRVRGGFSEIYVRHSSMAKIVIDQFANAIINILDGADVVIEAREGSHVTLFDYGSDTSYLTEGDVNVKNRHGFWERARLHKYAENIHKNE